MWFVNENCIIQDPLQRKIGSGKLKHGLYHLDCGEGKVVPVVSHVNATVDSSYTIPNSAIWHFRFGHASSTKIDMLSKNFPAIHVNKSLVSDICHLARQRRLPFVVSNNRAENCFDLMHLDVWGPCSLPSIHRYRFFLTMLMITVDTLGQFC